jgi:transcriptional regulator with XRE-family HTH domain
MAVDFLERMGARIRDRRLQLRLSRADLARLMPGKVSENQIYRWEMGKHQIRPDTLEALAEALDCTVADLMVVNGDAEPTPDPFGGPGAAEDPLVRLEDQIRLLRAELALSRAEMAAHAAEVLQRIDASRQPRALPQRQQP